ncbi:MAG: tetratricopeptide repeat protein [Myxococcota bacterium]
MITFRLVLSLSTVLLTLPAWAAPVADADEITSDPRAWIVPESRRDEARRLVDPGRSGLPGGLVLEDLELGNRITATYRSDDAALTAYVAPAETNPEDALWTGERLALGVVSTDLSDEARDRAVARLRELLEDREGGWGWLRVPPDAEEREEGVAEARALARDARRLAWMGDRGAVLDKAKEAVAGAPKDLPTLIRAARALHLADAGDMARGIAERAVTRAAGAVDGVGADEMGARTRATAASAAALAGDLRTTRNLVAAVLQTGHVACELDAVLLDLELSGHAEEVAPVAGRVLKAAPDCDEVRAAWADVTRRSGDGDAARRIIEDGLEASPGSITLRTAKARLALAGGRPEEAVTPARVAAQRGDAAGRSAPTLAAVAAADVVDEGTLEAWDGEAATSPDDAGALVLGAVSCLARGDDECAAQRFDYARDLAPPGAQGLAALHALALARSGQVDDARRALDAAWDEERPGPEAVAAEAALARADGEKDAERRAVEAYLSALERGGGPVSRADAEARLAALEGEAPAAEPEGAEPETSADEEPPEDGSSDIPLWMWFGLGLVLAALGAALFRRR